MSHYQICAQNFVLKIKQGEKAVLIKDQKAIVRQETGALIMQRSKIACNATNSAAIDHEGTVWVWGAARHRLLGGPQDLNQTYPKPLQLEIANNTEEEKKVRDAFLREDEIVTIKVSEIAMGQNHMLAIGDDAFGSPGGEIEYMEYAEDIFIQLKEHLIKTGAASLSPDDDVRNYEESALLEMALKTFFIKDKPKWPNGRWATFINLLFHEVRIVFQHDTQDILSRLQNELAEYSSLSYINLRVLRNQILKQNQNPSVVFGWGLADERLLRESKEGANPLNSKQGESDRFISATMLHELNKLKIERIACGDSFSLALTAEGKIYSWGIGQNGCLGLGDTTLATSKPKRVHLNMPRQTVKDEGRGGEMGRVCVKAIACGQSHCLALTTKGVVFSWGAGLNGRLGHGDLIGSAFPEMIRALSHLVIIDIACGDSHSAVVTDDGQVYTWGSSDNAKLGISEQIYVDRELPQCVDFFESIPVKQIFLGLNNSFAISKSNEVYAWGSCNFGKVGIPGSHTTTQELPIKLWLKGTQNVLQIAPGPFHSLFLSREGEIYVCGSSNEGKLGIFRLQERMVGRGFAGNSQGHFTIDWPWLLEEEIPSKFYQSKDDHDVFETYPDFARTYTTHGMIRNDGKSNISQLLCSQNNSYILFTDGRLYTMGINDRWQCTELESMKQEDDETVSEQLLEINQDERRWLEELSGDKNDGKQEKYPVFIPHNEDHIYLPVIPVQCRELISKIQAQRPVKRASQIQFIDKKAISSILIRHVSAGPNHALACTTNFQVFGWGDNDYGQLGLNMPLLSDQPLNQAEVVSTLANREIVMTACGKAHSLFLTKEGRIWTSGFNEFGQLGIPIDEQAQNSKGQAAILLKCKPVPIQVNLESKIRFIASGLNHSLAISSARDGLHVVSDLYTWGNSSTGQLGHHDVKNAYNLTAPKKVEFLEDQDTKPVFVSAGPKHTMCIDSESNLWYFGEKISVGIQDKQEKYMFEPRKLKPKKIQDREEVESKFKYVGAGVNLNLAITKRHGKVYQFGQDTMTQVDPDKDESVSEDEKNDDEDSDENGDRPLEANMSFGQEKFDEANFEFVDLQPQVELQPGQDDVKEARLCSVGGDHQMVLSKAVVELKGPYGTLAKYGDFAFSWGSTNQFGQLGLADCQEEMTAERVECEEQGLAQVGPEEIKELESARFANFHMPQTIPVIDRRLRYRLPDAKDAEMKKDNDSDDEGAGGFAGGAGVEGPARGGGGPPGAPGGGGGRPGGGKAGGGKAGGAGGASGGGAAAGIGPDGEPYDEAAAIKRMEERMYKWRVQYYIHETKDEIIKTTDLLKKDDMIVNQFNLLTQDFHTRIQGRTQAVNSMTQIVQDAFVYRIQNFPTAIEKNSLKKVGIPKMIIRSKQVFEGIFTYLQAHPCYINTWIRKLINEPPLVVPLLKKIFGRKEIIDNPRAINTLSVIARTRFDEEIKNYSVFAFTQLGQEESVFRAVFRLIIDSQSQNKNFNNKIATILLHKMRNNALHQIKDSKKLYSLTPKLIKKIMQETMAAMLKELTEMDSTDVFHELSKKESNTVSLQVLSLLNYVYKSLIEKTRRQYNIPDGGDDGQNSDEETEVKNDAAGNEDEKDDDAEEEAESKLDFIRMRDEVINPFLMNLLFESAFDQINDITYEQIKFGYWDYEQPVEETKPLDPDDENNDTEVLEDNPTEPKIRIFDDFNEKQYYSLISSLFVRYFRRQYTGLLEEEKENYEVFLRDGFEDSVSRDTTNYRTAISRVLFIENKYKPLNFDYLLVKQMFVTSMMPTDPVIAISIGDLVDLYNTLVDNKEARWIDQDARDSRFKDPLSLLRQELGDTRIELTQNKQRQINLRIKVRFLVSHSKLLRCRSCSAPVIETMVPSFKARYSGHSWQCDNPTCRVMNGADRSRCVSCGKNISELKSSAMKESIFERYMRLQQEELDMLEGVKTTDKNQGARNVERIKRQTNVFIWLLRELPRLENIKGNTFRKLLTQQIGLLDEKYGRIFDPLLKKGFIDFKREIELYTGMKLIEVENAVIRKTGTSLLTDEMRFAEGERMMTSLLRKVASRKLRKKVAHRDRQIEYGQALMQVQVLHGQIFNESVSLTEQLDRIFYNINLGLSSPFLIKILAEIGHFINLPDNMRNDPSIAKDTRAIIWAGSLNKKSKKQIKQAQRGGEDVQIQLAEPKYMQRMQAFFRDINAKEALAVERVTINFYDMEEVAIRKKAKDFMIEIMTSAIEYVGIDTADDMTTVGSVTFVDMLNSRVLKKADLTNYDYDEAVLMDSMFQLSRDSNGGFYIEMVFKEPDNPINQVALHRFYLAREDLLEMRINFFNNAVFINGNFQFRVYELVKLLNVVIAQNNVFSRLNPERIEQRRLDREKLKKDRSVNSQIEQEAMKSNQAVLL